MSSDVIYQRVRQITCANCHQVINVAASRPFTQFDCPHCHAKLTVPAMLGTFMLLEVLGTGGMGAVYRAMDQSLGRFVAIKVMKKQLGDDQKLVESFLREARAAAALNHPNIVQIYSCGEQQGQPFIAMELVSGGRLDLLMENGKIVPEERLLQISRDVAQGLQAANELGLVHGDIKPANILFDKHGTAKIVDFGLAQFVNRQTERGEIWGTPYYISPERARGGKADHRSDIYSLGATMFHALTGHPPFDGQTASDVVVARLKSAAPDLRTARPDVHPETASLVNRMMAMEPLDRYPTTASLMADMRDALAAAKTPLPASKQKAAGTTTSTQAGTAAPSKMPLIIGGIVVLAAIGGAIAFFGGGKKKPAPAPVTATQQPAPAVTQTAPPVAAGDEVFFRGDDDKNLAAAIVAISASPSTPDTGKLDAFAATVPKNSGRYMWMRVLQGLAFRMKGQELQAVDEWNAVARSQVSTEAGHPNHMPRNIARTLLGQFSAESFATWSAVRPAWYNHFSSLLRGTDLLVAGKYQQARPLLDVYAAAPAGQPAWAYAMQPAARQWIASIDQFRASGGSAKASGNTAGIQDAANKFKAAVPPMLQKVDPNAFISDIAAGKPGAPAPVPPPPSSSAAISTDTKLINDTLAAERGASIAQRDYTAAADKLVALNQKLTTREGREQLANLVNQLDRMEGVKGLVLAATKGAPVQSAELGGMVSGGDANGLRVGGKSKAWSQVAPLGLARVAAQCIASSRDSDKKKADDLVSLAVFCALHGETAAARDYAGQARGKDASAAAILQKLQPGL